jgi:hypothetical protein
MSKAALPSAGKTYSRHSALSLDIASASLAWVCSRLPPNFTKILRFKLFVFSGQFFVSFTQ